MSKTIVVIEDDINIANILTQSLEKNGYAVKTITSGLDGFNVVKKSIPDLVLLDIMLPQMDGLDILAQMKMNDKTKRIPVIMCTALSEMKDVEKCLSMGANGYITKPFDINRVLAKVSAVLNQPAS